MGKYDIDTSMTTDELFKQYKRMAKAADQRLVRLEGYEKEPYFKTATKWAYSRAMNDIEKWATDEQKALSTYKPRFNTKVAMTAEGKPNRQQLIAKMNDIRTFLEAPTSTKTGITNVYKKRADSINKAYGTKFTWQTMAKYYESADSEKADKEYGSKTVAKAIAVIQKKGKKQIDQIQDANEKIIIEDDKQLEKVVNNLLNDSNFDIEKLFK